MITYVELKNFKSFKNTRFDFRKGKKSYKKFVAIYGENGSGKSNFVDSLSFLRLSLESFHMVVPAEQLQQIQKTAPLPDELVAALTKGDLLSFQKVMATHRMIECTEPTTIELGFVFNNHSGYYLLSFEEGIVGEKLYYFTGKQSGVMFDLSVQDGQISTSFCGSFFNTREAERELKTLIDQYWGKHSLLSILHNERERKNAEYINKSYLSYVFEPINMILFLTAKHSIGSLQAQNANVNYKGVIDNPMEGLIAAVHEQALDQTERILNGFIVIDISFFRGGLIVTIADIDAFVVVKEGIIIAFLIDRGSRKIKILMASSITGVDARRGAIDRIGKSIRGSSTRGKLVSFFILSV